MLVLSSCGQRPARPPTTDSKLSGDDAVAEGLAAFGAASLQGKHFRRDIKIIGNRFSAGVTPKRDQMMTVYYCVLLTIVLAIDSARFPSAVH